MTVPLRIGLLCLCLLPASPRRHSRSAIDSRPSSRLRRQTDGATPQAASAKRWRTGSRRAVSRLGRQGFAADQAVKILVPKKLRKITDTARNFGFDKQVDAFELYRMNRAAESAVPSRQHTRRRSACHEHGGCHRPGEGWRDSSHQTTFDAQANPAA
ncbi:MAG: DUF4197 family protein [Pseudomonadales bacterium]